MATTSKPRLTSHHVKWLLEMEYPSHWNKQRKHGDLPENYLPCHRARQLDLSDKVLSGIDLSNLEMRNVNFSDAVLCESNFREADMRGVNFTRANCTGADFSGADLTDTTLTGVNLRRTCFGQGAILRGADLSRIHCSGATFSDAILDSAKFHSTNLIGTRFHDCSLRGADFFRASFGPVLNRWKRWKHRGHVHCSFAGADLAGAQFVECNLTWVVFDNAVVADTQFVRSIPPNALPSRLRLAKQCRQILTNELSRSFFTRPVIEALVPLNSEEVVQAVAHQWIAMHFGKEIKHGVFLVGSELRDATMVLQLQGRDYRLLYTVREDICNYFRPLNRGDWSAWSSQLTPKQRLEAIAAMMRDEQVSPERKKELEKLLALELPKSTTIRGDAPAIPTVHNHYNVSDGGKIVIGDDHSASTEVRGSIVDGSAVGQQNRAKTQREVM